MKRLGITTDGRLGNPPSPPSVRWRALSVIVRRQREDRMAMMMASYASRTGADRTPVVHTSDNAVSMLRHVRNLDLAPVSVVLASRP